MVLTLEQLDSTPITSTMVREWTRKDPVLAQVVQLLEEGWLDTVKSEELLLYYYHVTHPGVSRMKALPCSYVYWPGIDKDIERLVLDFSGTP